jgi:hypothetical protein
VNRGLANGKGGDATCTDMDSGEQLNGPMVAWSMSLGTRKPAAILFAKGLLLS